MSVRSWRTLPGAEAFEFPGRSDVGVVLIHGFTGAPAEMRPIGEFLAGHGIASAGVRLRGHGTHPEDMVGRTYADWIDDVESVLADLLTRCDRAVLVGLSMGGTLALNVAARHADDPRVAGVMPICAPIVLDDWRLGLVRYLSRVVRWQGWGLPDIKDRDGWNKHVGYRRFRLSALVQLIDLMRETRALLPAIRQPILVLQATDDHVVPPRNAHLIHDSVNSPDRDIILLDNCYHVVTVDHAADRVNATVLQFVEQQSGIPAAIASS